MLSSEQTKCNHWGNDTTFCEYPGRAATSDFSFFCLCKKLNCIFIYQTVDVINCSYLEIIRSGGLVNRYKGNRLGGGSSISMGTYHAEHITYKHLKLLYRGWCVKLLAVSSSLRMGASIVLEGGRRERGGGASIVFTH